MLPAMSDPIVEDTAPVLHKALLDDTDGAYADSQLEGTSSGMPSAAAGAPVEKAGIARLLERVAVAEYVSE